MTKQKTLYSIRTLDVINVARELGTNFEPRDFNFIEDKIGDFFGSQWHDAVEYALVELRSNKKCQ